MEKPLGCEERDGGHVPVLGGSMVFGRYGKSALWRFAFGAYGWTIVYVYGGSLDDALETAAEWLKENAPGLLSEPTEADGFDAATGEWPDHTYTEAGWIPSWEWHVDEITDSTVRRALAWRLLDAQEADFGEALI